MAENTTELLLLIETTKRELNYGLNSAWVLITGIGIILMQAGFMALEVGTVRAKNVKACLFKNTVDHAVGALAWYCIGWSLFVGNHPFASGEGATFFLHPQFEYARIFQQYGFAVTASTIVSGAVLSRCRLRVYVVFSFLLAMYIYPIAAHWAWVPGGWLYELGYLDFAGSSVVHVLGGVCALAGAWACGPRVGRFGEAGDGGSEASKPHYIDRRGSEHYSEASFHGFSDMPFRHKLVQKFCCGWGPMYRVVDVLTLNGTPGFRVREQPGHSAPMQCMGALLLYVAWFSFNAGSSGGMDTIPRVDSASRAAVNTMLAAASASVTALLWSDFILKQYDLDLVINSLLSGMVAVTAGCGYIEPYAAILVGIAAIPVYVGASKFVLYGLHIDDPLNATAVHGACGVLGTIWTGLFDINNGLVTTGNARLLGVQALGCLCIAVWSFVNAILYFMFLKYALPLLVCRSTGDDDDNIKENSIVYSADAQLVGLDFFYFGGSGFPDFDVEAVSEYNATQRIKNKFKAKRLGSMRVFDRDVELSVHRSEASAHGGNKHVSASFGTTPVHSPPVSPANQTSTAKASSTLGAKTDAHEFAVENPSRTGRGD